MMVNSNNELDDIFKGLPSDCVIALGLEATSFGFGQGVLLFEGSSNSFIFAEQSPMCLFHYDSGQYSFDSQGYGESLSIWAIKAETEGKKFDECMFAYGSIATDTTGKEMTTFIDNKEAPFIVKNKDEMYSFLLSYVGEKGFTAVVCFLEDRLYKGVDDG